MENWISAADLAVLGQILWVNIVLSGDNAVVIGMAAAGLPPQLRTKAVAIGIVAATVLRIGFALIASQLLAIVGVKFVGGLLLFWIGWNMWSELRSSHAEEDADGTEHTEFQHKTFSAAMWQIMIADITMSLDNVVAVVAAAGENFRMLIVGLLISILLMGVASNIIAKLLVRYRWISFLGLLVILLIAGDLTWKGGVEVAHYFGWLKA